MTDAAWIAVAAAIPPTIMALAALVTSWRNGKKVDDLHVVVNSRLTQLLEQTEKSANAAGVISGIAEGVAQRVITEQALKESRAAGVIEGGAIVTAGIASGVAKAVIEDVIPAVKGKNSV